MIRSLAAVISAVILNAVQEKPVIVAVPALFALLNYSFQPALAQDAEERRIQGGVDRTVISQQSPGASSQLSFEPANFSAAPSRINAPLTGRVAATSNEQAPQFFNAPNFHLRGKVEAKDTLQLLSRPIAGYDALGRSVKVLAGSANALQGLVEDHSLEAMLKSDNFKLQKMNARSDFGDSGMARMGSMMSPGFSWGIGNSGGMRMWEGFHDLGPGNGTWQPDWSAFAWHSTFDRRQVQSNLNWANQFAARGGLLPDGSRNAMPWSIAGAQTIPQIDERQILCDAWYQNISRALYSRWKNPGEHPGKATLHITVQSPRKIQALVIFSSNRSTTFRDSLLAAVQSLNGSNVLDFPQQSAKTMVSFDSVFSAGLDTASGAFSDRHNETEQIIPRRR